MMKYFQKATLLLSLSLLLGFAGCSKNEGPQPIKIGKGTVFNLETPASFQGVFTATQKLQIDYSNEVKEVIVQVEIDSEALRIVAIGQMGLSLFQLGWDGKSLTVEKLPVVKLPFAPEYLIATLQLALWPQLPNNKDLKIIEGPKQRKILSHGKTLILIDYPQGIKNKKNIVIHDLSRNFKIKITDLE